MSPRRLRQIEKGRRVWERAFPRHTLDDDALYAIGHRLDSLENRCSAVMLLESGAKQDAARKQFVKLASAAKTIRHFIERANDGDVEDDLAVRLYRRQALASDHEAVAIMQSIEAVAVSAAATFPTTRLNKTKGVTTVERWIVELGALYQKHSGRKPAVSRSKGDRKSTAGPFVTFAQAALLEAKQQRPSISAIFEAVRKNEGLAGLQKNLPIKKV